MLAHRREGIADLLRVGEVDLVPVRGAAGGLDRQHRVQRRAGPLDPRQLALDELRRGLLAGLLQPLDQRALEPVAVGDEALEVGVVAVGGGNEVEEVERGTVGVGGQVGGDRRDDAASAAGDDDRGAFGEAAVRVFLRRTLDQADRPAQVLGVTDLDRAGIAQGLLDQKVGERRLRFCAPKSTALISAPARSRASALVKPVTAPPMIDSAPVAS